MNNRLKGKTSFDGRQSKTCRQRGGYKMARRRQGVMSDDLKYEIAKELGVDDIVKTEGWGGVSSRDCGNMVKIAIEMAEKLERPV